MKDGDELEGSGGLGAEWENGQNRNPQNRDGAVAQKKHFCVVSCRVLLCVITSNVPQIFSHDFYK